ncbi:MAG: UDP-3-O-acyl-N-acetylglucosamine deacetylase [bacterium]
MNTIFQKTIKKTVSCTGIGLHTGIPVKLFLKPAPIDTGIRFIRTDISSNSIIDALPENIKDTAFATTIGNNEFNIRTIEHLMAAFAGLQINNIIVEINGPEIPAMDGSAFPFVELLQNAGIIEQHKAITNLILKKTVSIIDRDKYIKIKPNAKKLSVLYKINFNHHLLKNKSLKYEINNKTFIDKIAKARTFGFLEEVDLLRKNGLAKGGSLDNAVVLGKDNIINGKLRFKDELIAHKILDLIGDLYLSGYSII